MWGVSTPQNIQGEAYGETSSCRNVSRTVCEGKKSLHRLIVYHYAATPSEARCACLTGHWGCDHTS
jgi:hypothetical protein